METNKDELVNVDLGNAEQEEPKEVLKKELKEETKEENKEELKDKLGENQIGTFNIFKEGWVYKQSRFWKVWRKRW
jgi:hypothetical protein